MDNDCGVVYFFPLETVKFSINCIRRKRLSKIFLMTFYVICPLFGTSTDAIETYYEQITLLYIYMYK